MSGLQIFFLPSLIAKSHALLGILRAAQPNLSFVRKQVYDGIAEGWDEFWQEWGCSPEHKDDYVETMTRRVQNLCHVVADVDGRKNTKKKPAWV